MRISGRLAVAGDSGGEVAGDVVTEDDRLKLLAGDELLGSWPVSEVRALDLGQDRFGLMIGDERLLFTPTDPDGFRSEVLPMLNGDVASIDPSEPLELPHVVLGGPVDMQRGSESIALLEHDEPANGHSGSWSVESMPAVPEDLYGAGPDDDRPEASLPDQLTMASILAKAIVDVRDGALDPERGRAMAALASAYVQLTAQDPSAS